MTLFEHTCAVAAIALGSLLFGFDTAVIFGVPDTPRENFALGATIPSAAVSAALWDTLTRAIVSGAPGDRFGALHVLGAIGLLDQRAVSA